MEFFAYHDSQDLFFRNPFGAISCGQEIVFRLVLRSTTPIETCMLRLWFEDQEILLSMTKLERNPDREFHSPAQPISTCFYSALKSTFEVSYRVPDQPGLIWYFFIIPFGSKTYYYGNNDLDLGGLGELKEQEPPAYQITVYTPSHVPEWYKKGVMYQIYVDRFYNGNDNGHLNSPKAKSLIHSDWLDTPFYITNRQGQVTRWNFFGGNLQGVKKKLPYLKALGISILYLNPIFDSPSNHKYDTADYHRIDSMYGTERDFEDLVQEAQKLGIAILLDGVFNHTGNDSIYFNQYGNYPSLGAYQSPDSPYFNWFRFNHYPEDYKSWWGVEALPEVNELDPSYRAFIYGGEGSVLDHWMKKGIKGWRLDVADELPDPFIQELRTAMKANDPESVLIGEVWEDASHKRSYGNLREYFWGRELDATMNYPFREIFLHFILGTKDAERVHQKVMSLYENYPRENFYAEMNLLGSHDRRRILTILGGAPPEEELTAKERETYRLSSTARKRGIKRLKLLSLLQMTFPGVPCIYYGDEAGLEGYSDPFNRGTYPWGKEDPELLAWYRQLIRLRQEYDILQTGEFISFWAGPDVYGFKRTGREEDIIIILNRHETQRKEITLNFSDTNLLILDLLQGSTLAQGEVKEFTLEILPLQGRALLVEKTKTPEMKQGLIRSCGILMHVSSLPSAWGIGDMGEGAYQFVDFLKQSGQSLWQILPLNPPGADYSPYQSESAFAGNPLLISIELIMHQGLLTQEEVTAEGEAQDYLLAGAQLQSDKHLHPFTYVKPFKENLYRLAFSRFQVIIEPLHDLTESRKFSYLSSANYQRFLQENQDWLEDYALFRALKSHFKELPWYEWEIDIATRKASVLEAYAEQLAPEIEYVRFIQYTFYAQWRDLKHYAQEQGIQIIGDIPIFVAEDSCDTWANREFFVLDEKGRSKKLAGVPPDYFCSTGQLWGNPVYNWEALDQKNFSWWKQRIKQSLTLSDFNRLDHFRGFEAYWEVSAGEETAINGNWIKGPGVRFFRNLKEEFGELPLIAEDLGVITPAVKVLKKLCGFPGMKVLQFNAQVDTGDSGTRDSDDDFDFRIILEPASDQEENLVYYTGTHDNDTLYGWVKSFLQSQNSSSSLEDVTLKRICQKLIEQLYRSEASWIVLPMQDLLGLDSAARMNIPGTIEGNWKWQLEQNLLTTELKDWLKTLAQETGRTSL
ncbi:bifunctional glycogen debranching protein GlgX/4-alpha-glucanotransferase [Desulfitobacterium sp.]|uniref:bifunctional glycogen debranching protein GlgX/4-alpha-glucanotransferase n=1 Tax=Desulfitobacterium sp. TaxID=49981 RepID=UPI002C765FFA|nr:bifunctional glycogen debranching protein GlgX/4-alpha-glucanotransferase [Desulfitobacterium sp.]HVJ49011.1 bifunctional glycogen debranching protein GlgX/4-alpha-glucanotransferase [Desulfitobacterium sp.]